MQCIAAVLEIVQRTYYRKYVKTSIVYAKENKISMLPQAVAIDYDEKKT